MKLAIFASGFGSNFTAIQEAVANGNISAQIGFLFCDKHHAKVIQKAKKAGISYYCFEPNEFSSKHYFEEKLVRILDEHEVDLIVLAGYMRLIGPTLLSQYHNRILNIHPSMLPDYPGTKSIQEAFTDQVAYSGVTIHFIDEGIDTGPIIAQKKVVRLNEDTLDTFEERIHALEHSLYPTVIEQIIQERGQSNNEEESIDKRFR